MIFWNRYIYILKEPQGVGLLNVLVYSDHRLLDVILHMHDSDLVLDSNSDSNEYLDSHLNADSGLAEWSKVLIPVPWPLMVLSTLALGTLLLRFVS